MLIYLIIGLLIGLIAGYLIAAVINKKTTATWLAEIANKQKQDLEHTLNKMFLTTGESLSANYGNKVNSILAPFKENLSEFKQRVETIHNQQTRQTSELKGSIDKIFISQQRLSEEANNLAKALRGNVKQQGLWGEEILKRVLECAGLIKGKHYIEQASYNADSGVQKPDFIIKLSETREIILDAKLSLNSYVEYSNALSKGIVEDQSYWLKQIKENFKNHIKSLVAKQYYNIQEINTVSAVFMFIPSEPLFGLLVEHFPDIFLEASSKGVCITSPISLMPLLELIKHNWQINTQNKNIANILSLAGKIHERVANVLENVEEIKKSLHKADGALENLEKRLIGRDSIVVNAKKLEKLGVSNKNKQIIDHYLEEDELLIIDNKINKDKE